MATGGAIQAVQTAIYNTLIADGTLMDLATGGVHNDVPDGQAFPHVLISLPTEQGWHRLGGSATGLGFLVEAKVHVFSRYQGDKEALDIHERIVTLLNFQNVAVSGFSSAMWKYEKGRIVVEDIDKIETRHLIDEINVWVQQ